MEKIFQPPKFVINPKFQLGTEIFFMVMAIFNAVQIWWVHNQSTLRFTGSIGWLLAATMCLSKMSERKFAETFRKFNDQSLDLAGEVVSDNIKLAAELKKVKAEKEAK